MRWASKLLLALAGCNQILGSTEVVRSDAAYYDGGTDAATTCAGTPQFSRAFVQILTQDCVSFTAATNRQAAAICGPPGSKEIDVGVIGSALTSDPNVVVPQLLATRSVRMSADGTRLSVGTSEAGMVRIALFERAAAGWTRRPDIVAAPALNATSSVSEITLGPRAHVLVAYAPDDVRELEEQEDHTWLEVGRSRIHVASSYGVHLSGDGLRSWTGTANLGFALYTRPDRDSSFTVADALVGTDGMDDVFLAEDCGRLYFSTLGSVWAAPRIP